MNNPDPFDGVRDPRMGAEMMRKTREHIDRSIAMARSAEEYQPDMIHECGRKIHRRGWPSI